MFENEITSMCPSLLCRVSAITWLLDMVFIDLEDALVVKQQTRFKLQ